MAKSFNCFDCKRLYAMVPDDTKACPSCASTNGEVLSPERVQEGLATGVFYNIDPKTGRRSKKSPRRS